MLNFGQYFLIFHLGIYFLFKNALYPYQKHFMIKIHYSYLLNPDEIEPCIFVVDFELQNWSHFCNFSLQNVLDQGRFGKSIQVLCLKILTNFSNKFSKHFDWLNLEISVSLNLSRPNHNFSHSNLYESTVQLPKLRNKIFYILLQFDTGNFWVGIGKFSTLNRHLMSLDDQLSCYRIPAVSQSMDF